MLFHSNSHLIKKYIIMQYTKYNDVLYFHGKILCNRKDNDYCLKKKIKNKIIKNKKI